MMMMMVNATQTTTMPPFESLVPMVAEQQLEHLTTSKEPQKPRSAVDQPSVTVGSARVSSQCD